MPFKEFLHIFIQKTFGAQQKFSGDKHISGNPEDKKFLIGHPSEIRSEKFDYSVERFGHCI